MSKQIFPPEILHNTVEVYHVKIHTRSKAIYWLILCLLGVAFAVLFLVKVDITSQSRGVIRTPYENTVIQTMVYGEIVTYNMAENKTISVGDTLLVLNSDKIAEQIMSFKQKISENQDFISNLQAVIDNRVHSITLPQYRNEHRHANAKIKELQITVDYLKRDLEVNKKLHEKKIISSFDYLQSEINYQKANEQITAARDEFLTAWQNKQTNFTLQVNEWQSTITQLEKELRQYVVIAPVNGRLLQVAGFRQGNFIAPSQTLAYISSNDSLLTECYVSPANIAYLYVGQSVHFQIDAFNYHQWGMIEGSVKEILTDVVIVNEKPMFRVRCSLHAKSLRLKNGCEGSLQKGMTCTARFMLNRRTLWQLLFDKLDNWLNPKIINKKE